MKLLAVLIYPDSCGEIGTGNAVGVVV